LSHIDEIAGFGTPFTKEDADLLGGPGENGFEIVGYFQDKPSFPRYECSRDEWEIRMMESPPPMTCR
jgi:hypothetical protein